MKPAGIYRFINNRTGEVYVGQSNNVYARKANHYKELSQGTHHNKGLQEDFDAGDKFTFEVVEKMPNASREELEEREIYYIEKFNSFYEGYNQTPGGEYDKYKGKYENGGDRLPYHKYKPVPKPKLLEKCPECGGVLVKRKGKYGTFAGCSNYPECTFRCSLKKVNFKAKKQTNHISTKYNAKTYIPPFRSVPCKYCGKLIKDTHTICPFCNSDLTKPSIEWKTCGYCGKKYNKIASVCPYCNNGMPSKPIVSQKKQSIHETQSKPITDTANEQPNYYKPAKIGFKEFCTQKCNYLTRTDCKYLSDKYDIDISNVPTTKKANPIVRNYLYRTNQWDSAMADLYKLSKEYEIGAPVKGRCPQCGGLLIRETKLFIKCENYLGCRFSCTQKYYEDNILELSSETEFNSSTTEYSKSKEKSNKQTTQKSDVKIKNYYGYWNKGVSIEKSPADEVNKNTTHKSKPIKNVKSTKSVNKYKNTRYCSNCGSKLDWEALHCWNCGEKIEKGKKLPTSAKRDWGEIITTILIVAFIILFIISLIIVFSDVEGIISTIATIIIVAGVCFGCYIFGGQS